MFFTKERLDRWQAGATILSLLAVPVLLGLGGWLVQRQTATEATRREYVQLALDILRDTERGHSTDQLALRSWAIDIVKTYTPVDMPEETLDALKRGALAAPIAPPNLTVQ